jgi:hypothetical protein
MPKNDITVDEFVKTKVLLQFQPVVTELRKLICQAAPNATEVMSYGIPNYRGKRGLAVISPAKTHITLAFSRGAEFEDKYGLLEGVGKVSKNLRFRDISDINKEAIHYYMKQALKLDTK